MKITEQRQGAVTVLKPEGALVEADAVAFKARLTEALSASLGRFVVDMSAVPYVDSKGLEALVDVTEEMGRVGQALRLCAANKTVREVLELTDLATLFDHFDDANAAVRSFL
ncbi:MAG: putative antagonist protein [Phycisphaerales bacterium]|jgi:anti-anti-sigma factor|nr:putative antagonist protein [Phycisphaerales bacterium]